MGGWHGFVAVSRRMCLELGAEKVVQRILRHAKSPVVKNCYIKAFDPAIIAAMQKMETTLDTMGQSAPRVQPRGLGQLW
jgi:hypothetical protein